MHARRIAFATLASAGVALGHILGYAIAHPDAASREAALSTHGYLPTAASVVIPAGIVVVLVWAVRTARELGVGLAARRLATAQVLAFLLQEVLERIVGGEPVTAVLAERGVWVGLVAQVLVAAAICRGLVVVRRAVRFVLRSRPRIHAVPLGPRVRQDVGDPTTRAPWSSVGSRGPPVVA